MSQPADAPVRELGTVVASWREEAAIIGRRGDETIAAVLRQCADEVASVAGEFADWLTEEDAALRAGWPVSKVKRHARLYVGTPHVQFERRRWVLRACIVPRRPHVEMARAAALKGAA